MRLATAAEMRALDRRAIDDYGLPGVVLMENAGRAAFAAIRRWRGRLAGQSALVLVGPGNNGGDGLVIARYLSQAGCRVEIVLLARPADLRGETASNWLIVKRLALPVRELTDEGQVDEALAGLMRVDFVVDALLGTGLTRPVSGRFKAVIERLNQAGRPVVAVDMPSGLDSDSGRVLGGCLRAELTVTFALAKRGQVVTPGRGYVGRLEVVDIGIPEAAVRESGVKAELLDLAAAARLLPPRPADGHKGTFGHLLLVAGSQGKTGAALLAAHGALRSGVGLVTLGVAKGLNPIFEASLLEAMTVPLASEHWLNPDDLPALMAALSGKDALVLGPGLGREEGTATLVARLYQELALPSVIDADALNCLAGKLPAAPAGMVRVLTPHPGEMARLTGLAVAEVQADRLGVAAALAREQGVVVLLKGAGTVIAAPDGRLAVNPTGNAGLASGGMGDVLAGVIGALLAQGLEPFAAAGLGAYAHGLAADRLARGLGRGGFLASELAAELPAAFQEIALSALE